MFCSLIYFIHTWCSFPTALVVRHITGRFVNEYDPTLGRYRPSNRKSYYIWVPSTGVKISHRNIKRLVYCRDVINKKNHLTKNFKQEQEEFLSDEGLTFETLDLIYYPSRQYTTFLYFGLYLNTANAAHRGGLKRGADWAAARGRQYLGAPRNSPWNFFRAK